MKMSNRYAEHMQKLLRQIDDAFSFLRQVDPTLERIREAGYFVAACTKTWHNIIISFKLKAHIIEDHAIESIQDLNGMDDKTKYFIEFPHQDDALQDRRTQGLRNYKQKHEYQHKAEYRA